MRLILDVYGRYCVFCTKPYDIGTPLLTYNIKICEFIVMVFHSSLILDKSAYVVCSARYYSYIIVWPAPTRFDSAVSNNFNTLRPRQNGSHFPDDSFNWIFSIENVWISINISPKFVPDGQINNIPALVQIMAWRRPGDKPLSEPMMVSLLTHICATPGIFRFQCQKA